MRNNINLRRERNLIIQHWVLFFLCSTSFILMFLPNWGHGQIPIPQEIKGSVNFLFTHDGQQVRGIGTGFFVQLKGEKRPMYLVTAKHVLMADSQNFHPKLCMKINTKGGADIIPIALSGSRASRIFLHSKEPNVDIAVIPGSDIRMLPGKPVAYYGPGKELVTLPDSMFATKDHFAQEYIQEGDETFYIGWFRAYYGALRNYPIVRFGRLSLLTNEKIPWNDETWGRQALNLYLIETLATKGVSGSPVFFRPNLQRKPGEFILDRPGLYLAGVLKGYFSGDEASPNSGIAAVVPAFQLQEILSSDEVKNSFDSGKEIPPPQTRDIEECQKVDKIVREHSQ